MGGKRQPPPRRRTLRWAEHDYSSPGAYYVTFATHRRRGILAEIRDGQPVCTDAGEIVLQTWRGLPQRYPRLELDVIAIQPDHVHFIVWIVGEGEVGSKSRAPQSDRSERRRMLLPKVVGYLKMNTAKEINRFRGTQGTRVWQRNYYERVVRDQEELARFRNYILNNPVAWRDDRPKPPSGRGNS